MTAVVVGCGKGEGEARQNVGGTAQQAGDARTKSAKLSCRCGMPADGEIVGVR
jgi:hypothetical protein